MKMGSTVAPAKEAGFSQLSKLLDLMENPEKAKRQLADLTAAIEHHKQIIVEAEAKQKQAADAFKTLDERARVITQEFEEREARLSAREKELKDKETKHELDIAALQHACEQLRASQVKHAELVKQELNQIDQTAKKSEADLIVIRKNAEKEFSAQTKALTDKTNALMKQQETLESKEKILTSREQAVLLVEKKIYAIHAAVVDAIRDFQE